MNTIIRTVCEPRWTYTLSAKRERDDSDADSHILRAQNDRHIVSKEVHMTAMQIHVFCKPRLAGASSVREKMTKMQIRTLCGPRATRTSSVKRER
jgi:hypothetical protein